MRSLEFDQRERFFRRHRVARNLGDQRDILPRGEARDEIVELEDEADGVAAEAGELVFVRTGQILAAIGERAVASGRSRPPRILSSVDFPLPEAPSSTISSPAIKIEVHAIERADFRFAARIDFGDAARGKEWLTFALPAPLCGRRHRVERAVFHARSDHVQQASAEIVKRGFCARNRRGFP